MKLYSEEFYNIAGEGRGAMMVQNILAATFIVAALLAPFAMMAAKIVG